jgi:hypothetical protein
MGAGFRPDTHRASRRTRQLKSRVLRPIYGLLGVACLLAGLMTLISWGNNADVAGIHGNGLLVYTAVFMLLGLVGVSGANTNWDR